MKTIEEERERLHFLEVEQQRLHDQQPLFAELEPLHESKKLKNERRIRAQRHKIERREERGW